MSTINDKFKERLNYLNTNSKINPPKEIKKDTFNKYLRGERFPTTDNLEIIKEHYHVSYSYLFGEFDNDEIDGAKISIALGLDKDVIEKLSKIQTSDSESLRNDKNFAINTFLRHIDFSVLGSLLTFPSYENVNIGAKDYYKYYEDFFGGGAFGLKQEIIENNEKINYRIFSLVNTLCKETRKTKECSDLFKEKVKEEKEREWPHSGDTEDSLENYRAPEPCFDFEMIDFDKEEMDKLIEERKKEIGI